MSGRRVLSRCQAERRSQSIDLVQLYGFTRSFFWGDRFEAHPLAPNSEDHFLGMNPGWSPEWTTTRRHDVRETPGLMEPCPPLPNTALVPQKGDSYMDMFNFVAKLADMRQAAGHGISPKPDGVRH